MWYVYVLLCDDKHFHVGTTDNLQERLKVHREGRSFFTKQFSDIKLVYQEWHPTKVSAEKRERQIKHWDRAQKLKLVQGDS